MEAADAGTGGRIAEIGADIIERHTRWSAHQHQFSNPTIKVKGDRAVSESYLMATLSAVPDAAGRIVDTHYRGRCLDRWSKRDGRWALDHRSSVSSFMWEQEVVEGPAGWSRRDRQDPAYEMLAFIGEPASHPPSRSTPRAHPTANPPDRARNVVSWLPERVEKMSMTVEN